jgi:hypothetical protein
MELKKITFEMMHQIVLTVMKERNHFLSEHEQLLSLVGKWYHKWLQSGIDELVLKIPFYKKDIVSSLIEYQYWLDLLIRTVESGPATEMAGYGLFDIITYKAADRYQRRNNDYLIEHKRSDLRTHRFEKNICLSTDRFLPLFDIENVGRKNELLADVFVLMMVLGRNNLMPYAVKFDLEQDLTLLVKQTRQDVEEKAFARTLVTEDFRNDNNKRDDVLDALLETDLRRCIVFTYPYHVSVSESVINEFRGRSNIFRVALSNRFAHGEVEANELILTRPEIGLGEETDAIRVIDRFSVITTHCDTELIVGIRALKYEWNRSKFNTFSNPFPVKWLLCIHQELPISFWKEQFKKDYQEVPGHLLKDALDIIQRVYELNWIDNFLPSDDQGTLVLPRSILHSEVIFSLKEYLIKRFRQVVLNDEIERVLAEGGRVYLMDPFNIVLLNNIVLEDDQERFQIIVPDFLIYTYQPFVRYLALKYYFDALIGGARERLDTLYDLWSERWNALSETVLSSSRKALKQFNNTIDVNDNEDFPDEQTEIIIDLLPAELVERVAAKERVTVNSHLPDHIDISTGKQRFLLRPNTPVMVNQNGALIRTIAAVLDEGDLFMPLDEVIKNMDLKKMIDRLVTLSEKARNWHQSLRALEARDAAIFDGLKSEGLSISKQTFDKDYLSINETAGELHMPRAKKDWMIICDRLLITDSLTAWNAVKCREDLNMLKATYSRIIELMIATSSFGINVSDDIIYQITAMLALLPESGTSVREHKKDAIALITEICDKISLEKIEQINYITL